MPDTIVSEINGKDEIKKDLLVTLADRNYIEQAKQLFSGVYWNAGWKGDYMLLAYEIPEKDLRWFRDKGILVRECEPVLKESRHSIGHAPLTTLSKFYLFTPEFKQWKNIVFLDGDIIVRGALDTLAEVKGFGAAGILNIFTPSLKGQFTWRKSSNLHLFRDLESKCDLTRPAFNSGVMAFCTDIIAADDFQNLLNILFHFKEILHISEETVLNIYFFDRWQTLPQIFNICPSYEMYLSGCAPVDLKGIILHTYSNFPGGKPWNPKSPLNAEWKANLDKADRMDIAKPQNPSRRLSKLRETQDDVYLKNLHKDYKNKLWLYKLFYFSRRRQLKYYTAEFLKNRYPLLYQLQRKLRNKT